MILIAGLCFIFSVLEYLYAGRAESAIILLKIGLIAVFIIWIVKLVFYIIKKLKR